MKPLLPQNTQGLLQILRARWKIGCLDNKFRKLERTNDCSPDGDPIFDSGPQPMRANGYKGAEKGIYRKKTFYPSTHGIA